jgi:hypothetical protein
MQNFIFLKSTDQEQDNGTILTMGPVGFCTTFLSAKVFFLTFQVAHKIDPQRKSKRLLYPT